MNRYTQEKINNIGFDIWVKRNENLILIGSAVGIWLVIILLFKLFL